MLKSQQHFCFEQQHTHGIFRRRWPSTCMRDSLIELSDRDNACDGSVVLFLDSIII